MNKGTYNKDDLIKYCNENNIILINDYNNLKITRDTIIEGKCITPNCDNNFNKTFRQLKKNEGFCDICTINKKYIKYKNTCLQKYGVENVFNSNDIKNKIKQTNLEKYGVEHSTQSEIVKNKVKQTCLQKYGVEHSLQSEIVKNKVKQTCLQKYGVENPFENKEIKEKIKVTNVKKYGFENPFESEIVKNQSKQTCLKNYGVEHSMQSEIVKNKSKQTCLNKYGVEHQMLLLETHDKIRQTCLKKYGFENSSQVPEIVDKKLKNSYKRKTYIFPSKNQIMCQGYEPFALDKLIKDELINETDIVTGAKNVPIIWYNDESGKKHCHYVDIFILSQNRMIEVKSTWTAEKKKDNIFLKQEAGKNLGYLYEIWVYNKKGEIVECHK
jgi:hypothetical protein